MKVALVYDRINKWGGAEKILLVLHEVFPDAPLYTAVFDPKKASWAKVFPKVKTTFLQKVPFLKSYHELLGIFTPIAFELFDFSEYDLVISVTSEAAKGIITRFPTKHICLCLTPTRYLWSGYEFYINNPQWPLSLVPFYKYISRPFLSYARSWDYIAAQRPDIVVAISKVVKERIKKYYNRDSVILHPPVEVNKFIPNTTFKHANLAERKRYFLVVSRLIPYKMVSLAIRALNTLNRPLYVVGTGSDLKRLKKIAKSNIKFFGFVSEKRLIKLYQSAIALIMPQKEDFGIVSVEAQASGIPVIAFKKGGARDTVVVGRTGLLFGKQSVDRLVDAVKRFDRMKFKTQNLVNNAKGFSKDRFKKSLFDLIENV